MSDPKSARLTVARDPAGDAPGEAQTLERLLTRVARGDATAFPPLYDALAGRVYGLVRQVVRDPAQSEEVTQEAMLDIWRTATRYDPSRASVVTWALTIGHRRAVDRVRAEESAGARDDRYAADTAAPAYDEVSEGAITRVEAEQVRRCLSALTELQRESVTLAYYGGHSYREVAQLLDANLSTVKARMRDGLIRLRDCLGSGHELAR